VDGFLRVATVTDLSATPERVLAVLGRKILLRRNAVGDLQALELACRHQNGDLSQAARDEGQVVCPRHGWTYDLGTGACLNEPWAALRRFAVREENGEIWLSLRPMPDEEPQDSPEK
jgi:nitrite reductase/ring-hydroxylating ferredoxin subunit